MDYRHLLISHLQYLYGHENDEEKMKQGFDEGLGPKLYEEEEYDKERDMNELRLIFEPVSGWKEDVAPTKGEYQIIQCGRFDGLEDKKVVRKQLYREMTRSILTYAIKNLNGESPNHI